MTSLATLLATLARALAASGTPYMITGSVASTAHGVPRALGLEEEWRQVAALSGWAAALDSRPGHRLP